MTPPIEQLSTQSLLLNIIESIPTRVFWKNIKGHYIGCNKVFAQDAGFSHPDEIIGKTDFDMPWSDFAEAYQNNDHQIISSGLPLLNHEESQLTPDRKTVWLKTSKAPLYDDEHNIIGIIGMYEDVTELKSTQHELELAKFVMENAPLNITYLDEKANIHYMNKTGIDTLGYTEDEILKLGIPDIDPTFPMEIWDQHWADLKKSKFVPVKTFHKRKNGEVFPIEVLANYVNFNGEEFNVAFDKDISEQEQIEKKLSLSEERFKLAMQGANDGLWDWNLETNHVYYSPRWFSMLGLKKDGFAETLETWKQFVHPEDQDSTLEEVSNFLEARSDTFEVEIRMRHRSGHYVTVLSRALKVCDPETQKPTRLVGTHVDITERKKHEQLLAASNQKFETLFNASSDAISIVSLQGEIIDLNKTAHERLGYTKEEMLSLSIAELTPPEEASTVTERISQLKQKGLLKFESAAYTKDGSIMPLDVTLRIIQLAGEDVIFVMSRDITEQKILEEQLLQSQKMESIGTLVGGIAHDFNNILAAIQGNLYLATKQSRSNPVVLAKLANIESLSTRAADMVQQLLTFARKDTVQMHSLSMNDFLNESTSLIRTSIPENINHCLELCNEPLFITGNTTQIQQLVINLINNARDAVINTTQPRISCSLTPFTANQAFMDRHPEQTHKQFACLTIEDNGCGIEPKVMEKIFEPFFTTKEVGQGTGLGLSMLYGAMQSHNGTIDVESSINHGTTFYLYFPIADKSTIDDKDKHSVIASKANEETILLVDDEVNVRATTAEALRSIGYEVIEASNGEQALQVFNTQANDIDLVLTDIVMPKMGGHELFAGIRKTNKALPIILVTGYDRSHVLKSNIKLENFEIINKPFNFDILSKHIQSLLYPDT